jgi:hypothetical protein
MQFTPKAKSAPLFGSRFSECFFLITQGAASLTRKATPLVPAGFEKI